MALVFGASGAKKAMFCRSCPSFTVLELGDHIWGYCYTQLTDVEQEQNGIFYYDRTPKFDLKVLHNIFSKTPDDVQKP